MKIETKYDIGQEVWVIEDLYYKGNIHAGKFAIFGEVESILTHEQGISYYTDCGGEFAEPQLFPTKEACEQAIKEMEG
jgi:hypothetical protein